MYKVETYFRTEEDFVDQINEKIKWWETCAIEQGRQEEFMNVIWGAHRILAMLKIDYEENNDVI